MNQIHYDIVFVQPSVAMAQATEDQARTSAVRNRRDLVDKTAVSLVSPV